METGEEFVITRNGKPFALLVRTGPQAFEDRLRALQLSGMAGLPPPLAHAGPAPKRRVRRR